ncbi:MAG: hypothetical protein RR135_00920 [Oscillospiraceae bacterium]
MKGIDWLLLLALALLAAAALHHWHHHGSCGGQSCAHCPHRKDCQQAGRDEHVSKH